LSQGYSLVGWSHSGVEGFYNWVEFELTQMSDVVVTVLEAVEFSTQIGEYGVEGVWCVIHGDSMAVHSHVLCVDVLSQLGDDM